jgi:hypothetical protein
MRPIKIDFDPADADADGLAAANDSSGASLTLDGALTSGGTYTAADGLGHKIDITDTATVDQSGATFTLTGTNSSGYAITEDVTGPGSGATVTSTKLFKTITSITIASPAVGGAVNVGTNDEVESKVVPLNWRSDDGATVAIMGASGTFQADIQETFDNILDDVVVDDANWLDIHADKSADGAFTLTAHATGVKVQTDSYTNGAEFQFHVMQTD